MHLLGLASACRIIETDARWVPSSRKSIGHPWNTSLTVQGPLFRKRTHNLKVLSSNLSPATLRHLKGCLFRSKPPCIGFELVSWGLSARFWSGQIEPPGRNIDRQAFPNPLFRFEQDERSGLPAKASTMRTGLTSLI